MKEPYLKTFANVLNSAVFSDILDEFGCPCLMRNIKPNIHNAKIFGRANTLKLRKLRNNEDYKGIYDAFDTYRSIAPGEIIVVENEVSDFAYFGELNANLAIRAGAAGVVIGGVTRDALEVEALRLPVFSMGYCCSDVLKRATMESRGKPICICGVSIDPGDLIFGDINGVVVIPKKIEAEVMEKAVATITREREILEKIIQNVDAKSIYESDGGF